MWSKVFSHTVTIVGKLGARDFGLPSDQYVTYYLDGASWVATAVRSVSSSGTVSYGGDVTVRVPEGSFEAAGITIVDRQGLIDAPDKTKAFYPQTGMWVFEGRIEDEITASNVSSMVSKLRPYAFIADEVVQNRDFMGAHVKFRGQ